jgi:hypothetical protein
MKAILTLLETVLLVSREIMVAEGKLGNKTLYKIEIKLIRILPSLLALFLFIQSIFSAMNINLKFLSLLVETSYVSILFIYITSYVFKFCSCHRIFLHYIVINNLFNILNNCNILHFNKEELFVIHILLFSVFLLITLYLYYTPKRT